MKQNKKPFLKDNKKSNQDQVQIYNVKVAAEASEIQKKDYAQGQNFLKNKNYSQAIEVFNTIISKDPTSPLAPNAAYWIGESLYVQGKYQDALQAFNHCFLSYPKSLKAPDALFKMAYSNNMLSNNTQAMANLDNLLLIYPNSKAAEMVKRGQVKFREPSI